MTLNNVTSISEELPFCEVKLKIYSEESVCIKTNKKNNNTKAKYTTPSQKPQLPIKVWKATKTP